jgi:probable F420-dependent oxidoreductase
MKVRVGLGVPRGVDLAQFVDESERLKFDSLWVSERVTADLLDPIVAMTFIAARTSHMKLGASVMVLPGRNPVLLAKALASLDVVSEGRLLPAFGLGVNAASEIQAFGVRRDERAALFEEALPLLRRLWAEDDVTHHGERFHLDTISVRPKPLRGGFDVWLGGAARPALARCGRLADGWLASFATPAAVRTGIEIVNDAAAAAGRSIDQEHFGVSLPYVEGEIPEQLVKTIRSRDPEARPEDAVATSKSQLRERIAAYVDAGASKFVVVPAVAARDWTEELEALADDLLPLQT